MLPVFCWIVIKSEKRCLILFQVLNSFGVLGLVTILKALIGASGISFSLGPVDIMNQ